jgi:hypothetical protein
MRPETLIYFVRFAWGDFDTSDEVLLTTDY